MSIRLADGLIFGSNNYIYSTDNSTSTTSPQPFVRATNSRDVVCNHCGAMLHWVENHYKCKCEYCEAEYWR